MLCNRQRATPRHRVSARDVLVAGGNGVCARGCPGGRPCDLRSVPQPLRLWQRLELLEDVVFDLPDPLAGDIERSPDLPEREREVIEMRFGLTGEPPCTLEQVGRAFNVTRERIRQIENHILKKLEALPEAQRLRDAS